MKRPDDILLGGPALRPATSTPEARGLARDDVRLLVSSPASHRHAIFRELADFLPEGALLVVNTSGTLPASLPANGRFGPFTLNLSTRFADRLWLAEPRLEAARPGPLPLRTGEAIEAAGVPARLVSRYPGIARLWFVAFESSVEMAMADQGTPIRYAYLQPPFPPIAAYQTIFASHPGSAEMPSAGRPFSEQVVEDLRRRGIAIAPIELRTGVSSLEARDGDGGLPLYPEPFWVPAATAKTVNAHRRSGRAVIAVGTTVVRALESAWDGQAVRPSKGFTRLYVDRRRGIGTVDGLVTGFHDPEATHLDMLEAIGGDSLVAGAYAEAAREGYLRHEFGDSHLILRR